MVTPGPLDFEGTLGVMLGWIGQKVEITVSAARGYPVSALQVEGILGPGESVGGDMLDEPPVQEREEMFLFLLEPAGALNLERAAWQSSAWDGRWLAMTIGPLQIRVAPLSRAD